MSRFFLPRHARTHLRGGSDPLLIEASDLPWGVISTGAAETLPAGIGMTFTFGTNNFNTNDDTVFSLIPGSPTNQGIAILQTGIYLVNWEMSVTRGSVSPTPDTIGIEVTPGSSFASTYVFELEHRAHMYGIEWTPGSGESSWHGGYTALVGIEDVASDRYLTLLSHNYSATTITAGGSDGAAGRISAIRISEKIASFLDFF